MNKKLFYTYVYLDPMRPGIYEYKDITFKYEPFYVGKGGNGDNKHKAYKRYKEHLNYAMCNNLVKSANPHKFYKIRKILSYGKKPIIRIIKKFELEVSALAFETKLISIIGRSDLKTGPLTNLTEGGDGCKGLSEETRFKISSSLKGKIFFNPRHFKKGHRPINYGIKMSDDQKILISQTLRNKYAGIDGEKMRENSSKGRKGKINSIESNLKRSQWLKEGYANGTYTGMKGHEAHNKGKTKYTSKIFQYSKKGFFIREWDSLLQIEDQLKINKSNICMSINNKRDSAGGFIWCVKKGPLLVVDTVL